MGSWNVSAKILATVSTHSKNWFGITAVCYNIKLKRLSSKDNVMVCNLNSYWSFYHLLHHLDHLHYLFQISHALQVPRIIETKIINANNYRIKVIPFHLEKA